MSSELRSEILICDDDEKRATRWARAISAIPGIDQFKVAALNAEEFADLHVGLLALQQRARGVVQPTSDAGKQHSGEAIRAAVERLDRAAMLIVDYDLTPASENVLPDDPKHRQRVLTDLAGRDGEGVACLARTYTEVASIVVVNQVFREPTVDLTMMRLARSVADVNVTHRDITESALWTGAPSTEWLHRPWLWPRLLDEPITQRALLAAGVTDLDEPVLHYLGLDAVHDRRRFHPAQLDPVASASTDDDPLSVTFRDVARSRDLGLLDTEDPEDERIVRRVAVFAVQRWLRRVVLPGQNVLVDPPHVRSRYPGIVVALGLDANWPELDSLSRHAGFAWPGELQGLVAPCSNWFTRPVLLASRLDEFVVEHGVPASLDEMVFAENTGRFVDRDQAHEVRTDIPGPDAYRFVELHDAPHGLRYVPRPRLLG